MPTQKSQDAPQPLNPLDEMSPHDIITGAFIERLEQFLDALSQTFDECQDTRDALESVTRLVRPDREICNNTVKQFYEVMNPHFAAIKAKDAAVLGAFNGFVYFSHVDLPAKFADTDIDDEDRDTLWWFLGELVSKSEQCGLTNAIPSRILDGAARMTQDMMSKMQSGEQGLDFNAMMQMCQSLMEDASEEDLKQLEQALPQLQQQAMAMMGGQQGMMSVLSQAQSGGMNLPVDPSMLNMIMSQMGGGEDTQGGGMPDPAMLAALMGNFGNNNDGSSNNDANQNPNSETQ